MRSVASPAQASSRKAARSAGSLSRAARKIACSFTLPSPSVRQSALSGEITPRIFLSGGRLFRRVAADFAEEPDASEGPESVRRPRGDAEGFSRIGDRQPGEVAQLDELGRL